MPNLLLAPVSWIYGAAVAVRNRLYDSGVKKSTSLDIPVLCVGNITVGGTGKTPMCELLVGHFRETYNVGVISRGYGRNTEGYLEVCESTSYRKVGDEPKQIKMKYPDIVVAVCKDRIAGIEQMRRDHPELNLIVMDDGFQYRKLEPKLNIVMVDYTRPIDKDHLLPLGRLRDQRRQMRRAHYVVVSKCPRGMTPLDRRICRNNLDLLPFQNLSFTRIVPETPYPAFPSGEGSGHGGGRIAAGSRIVAMAGIGNPGPFVESLRRKYDLAEELLFADHHPYKVHDLHKMQAAIAKAGPGTVIVTTEKDVVRLGSGAKIPADLRERIYVQPIETGFVEESREDFFKKLDYDVRTDQKNSLFHSR